MLPFAFYNYYTIISGLVADKCNRVRNILHEKSICRWNLLAYIAICSALIKKDVKQEMFKMY